MSDLTGIINQHSPAQVVEAWCEANNKPRTRLGLSECGHPCGRYLWYSHRGTPAKQPDGRTLRLFQLGNLIEDQAVLDLKSAGYTIRDCQKEVSITDDDVTLKGHIDGIIEGLIESSQPHLFECKSASDKQFQLCKKHGYERWNEKYKGQIHAYMLLLKLKKCLVWVENKNTSEVYTERIKLNREYAIKNLERVFAAITQKKPPERKCPNASWYEAKWCKYYPVCF